ncbi:MAG: phosphoenolpyruvate carboxylase [Bdellovibrionia bacterium]
MANINQLPDELRVLVKQAVAVLGEVIRRELGSKAFQQIEETRREMAGLRGASLEKSYQVLNRRLNLFRRLSPERRASIAHSFTLMLELINSCENAYRSYRLRTYPHLKLEKLPAAMIYVLTAHPTESRSSANIEAFHEIQKTLAQLLSDDTPEGWTRLRSDIEIAWHISAPKNRRPRVRDEAEHIYSIALREETLRALLSARREFGAVYLRSWVGGDKDGHPGVNEKTLQMSLSLSRRCIVKFFRSCLADLGGDLKLLGNTNSTMNQTYQNVKRAMGRLLVVGRGDGRRISLLHIEVNNLIQVYEQTFGVTHPALFDLRLLIQMFPALLVPIELREGAELIVKGSLGESTVIGKMLSKLASIAEGSEPRFYARGLIISMADSFEHIKSAAELMRKHLGGLYIPIIPLFEQQSGLKNAPAIMTQILGNSQFRKAIHNHWNGYLEVMLGYSDSAKELGALASRIAVMEAVQKLDSIYKHYPIKPVFFHGSGGSTDRGGGPIEEQTAWWPKSALKIYKATIQGEMVERTFASPEITRRRFEQIALQINRFGDKSKTQKSTVGKFMRNFALQVQKEYQKKIASPEFLKLVYEATPYKYLSVLRIGSRPVKRGNILSISNLRAIPWILCWTQTRVLFPTWWGIGKVWEEIRASGESKGQLKELRSAFLEIPVFRSYVKVLSSTLARVELPVWRLYLENCGLPKMKAASIFRDFEREYTSATEFVKAVAESRNLLWFRPWLGASIRLRSSMIHPLNLLQIIAIQENDPSLLRQTVTGISSGMMTTG